MVGHGFVPQVDHYDEMLIWARNNRKVAVSKFAMFPDLNFVDGIMILLGVLFLIKKVAEMERYYHLRIIILTSMFGVIVVLFLIALGSRFDYRFQDDYFETADHFTVSEM